MDFQIKHTPKSQEFIYKTLYIHRSLADRVQQIAKDNETSFNNVHFYDRKLSE